MSVLRQWLLDNPFVPRAAGGVSTPFPATPAPAGMVTMATTRQCAQVCVHLRMLTMLTLESMSKHFQYVRKYNPSIFSKLTAVVLTLESISKHF